MLRQRCDASCAAPMRRTAHESSPPRCWRRSGASDAAAQAVPPTVSPSILIVGCPSPTGTLCPSLPQVPTPSSSFRSLPTMDTRVSTSGPFPIKVAPLMGAVTWPSSIMYASDAEVHRVNSPLHGTNDVLRIILSGQHVRIRHTRHWYMFIALAPAVARIRHAHQSG